MDRTSIAQELGESEDKTISQKVISIELNKKTNTADVNSKFTEEKNRVNGELNKKFDKANIVQTTGDSEELVMSQKAATQQFSELGKYIVYNVNQNNDNTYYTLEEAIEKVPSKYRTIARAIIYKDKDGANIAIFDDNAYQSGFTNPDNWSVISGYRLKNIETGLSNALATGNLFFYNGVNRDGTENLTVLGTPFIKIDKNFDIQVKADEAPSTYSPLNFYDKDLNFISAVISGSAGIKEITILKENIPSDAEYIRCSVNTININPYVKNGIMSYDRLILGLTYTVDSLVKSLSTLETNVNSSLESKLNIGNLFYIKEALVKEGGGASSTAVSTPYITIDKESPIEVKDGYAMASTTFTKLSALNFYNEDFEYIGFADSDSLTPNDTTGVKSFTLSTSNIPGEAVYMRAGTNPPNLIGRIPYIKNGEISFDRIIVKYDRDIQDLKKSVKSIDDRVTAIENPTDKSSLIAQMADKYDLVTYKREQYLRNKYHYDKIGKWYGVTWKEEDDAHNVTDISSEGDEALCNELPIQNKMRRCVIKDGVLQYYLNADNSELKADGSQAKLDGTDGNVMVEIPEFFYKFEVSENDGVKTVKLMISENGIDGFNYSPKHYVGAYYATLNRETNILSTVCTTKFTRSEVELKTEGEDSYIEGDTYSLGVQKLAVRNGFTENAATYRGGHQNISQKVRDPNNIGTEVSEDYWDNANDPSQNTFCLNKLGVAVAQVQRSQCRDQSRMWLGETMYLYDTQKALWILSSVEFKTRNIQDAINKESPREGGLGWGATVYPNYDAYEAYFSYRGTACIPNGVTNNLGNHSGEVYYRMYQVPVEFSGSLGSPSFDRFANVLIPVMSYRGVENFYGHLYSTADQISLSCVDLGGENRRVNYWYQRNPFKCKTDISEYENLGQYEFESTIKSISGILMGFDGHILPIKTTTSYENGYCDCSEIGASSDGRIQGISFNGRLASKTLVGRNFIVSFWKDNERANRASESSRLCAFLF